MDSRRIRLRVTEVRLAVPASAGVEAGMVVLTEEEDPGRALRIVIGQPEARAIQSAWDGSVPSRPSTWDLFVSAIAMLGGRVEAAVITGVEQERHYFAGIDLEQGGVRRTLACRPSDAVALALRSHGAQILAEESVLDDAGVLPDGTKPGRSPRPTIGGGASADSGADGERELARREEALAERERRLAEREASLIGREQGLGGREEDVHSPEGRPSGHDPAVGQAEEHPPAPGDAGTAPGAGDESADAGHGP